MCADALYCLNLDINLYSAVQLGIVRIILLDWVILVGIWFTFMNYTDDKVKKIMVVDDEDDLIFLLQTLLDQMGFKVSGFTDPLLALQAFKAGTYNLAILDIRLPGLDGFELCERLKGIDPSLKVCFFTASEFYHKNSKKEQHSVLINEHHIIRKPISHEDLLKQVREVLELK